MSNDDPRQQIARELADMKARSAAVPPYGTGVTRVPIPARREPADAGPKIPNPQPPTGGISWQEWD
jgi:hypothetical protein